MTFSFTKQSILQIFNVNINIKKQYILILSGQAVSYHKLALKK